MTDFDGFMTEQYTKNRKHLCPKCGSEMKHAIGKEGTIAEGIEEWYCRNCGHEEDYCGHEEKVNPNEK